jgi:hypothetical protein
MNRVAIMQPYFFPYVGYFQLMDEVDHFVIYDDLQFTKKGWINRNYLYSDSGPWLFSIPVSNISELALISEKRIAPEYSRSKLISRIEQNYNKIATSEKLIQMREMINFESDSLFEYIHFSLVEMSKQVNIDFNKIITSSSLGDFKMLKGQDKVIQICKSLNADVYINPIGGKTLYDIDTFKANEIQLIFQESVKSNPKSVTEESQSYSFLHDYLTLDHNELRSLLSNR